MAEDTCAGDRQSPSFCPVLTTLDTLAEEAKVLPTAVWIWAVVTTRCTVYMIGGTGMLTEPRETGTCWSHVTTLELF